VDYLSEHPICEECIRAPATNVDHIDGLEKNWERRLDPTNFRALCNPCHSKKTAMEDRGFGRWKGKVKKHAF